MSVDNKFDAMFSGIIGQDYELLKLICPFAVEISRLVGLEVAEVCCESELASVVELGGGTGITTLAILSATDRANLFSVDNEPTMQNQAKQSLQEWVSAGRLEFCANDALGALKRLEDNSVDIIASAYTLHNFEAEYRKRVIEESYRVLKTGGWFINGDRYALDDIDQHTRITQQEVVSYFKALTDINRLDLLEHWIIHIFSDESENRIMREAVALKQLSEAGFQKIQLKLRKDVNALVTAVKP